MPTIEPAQTRFDSTEWVQNLDEMGISFGACVRKERVSYRPPVMATKRDPDPLRPQYHGRYCGYWVLVDFLLLSYRVSKNEVSEALHLGNNAARGVENSGPNTAMTGEVPCPPL